MLRLLALGHTNQEIAKQLYISVRTAETHRAHIMQSSGCTSRAELVRYAIAAGSSRGITRGPLARPSQLVAVLLCATRLLAASVVPGLRANQVSAVSGLRSAPPIARIAKPMPESSSATPTTIPKSASCSAM